MTVDDLEGDWERRLVGALPDLWFRVSSDLRFLASGGPRDDLYAPPASFLGRTLAEVLPAAVAEELGAAVAVALAGAEGRVEYALPIDQVERFFVAVVRAVGADEVAMFVREVTERVLAERRVADSERRFRAVVEAADEGVWLVDAAGITTFVTERMASMLGYAVTEIVGLSPLRFIDPAFHDVFRERSARRREGLSERGRIDMVARDGERVQATVAATPILDADGRYLGAAALLTDDRAAAHRERDLVESQRRLGAIAEVHDDVFYVGEILPDGSYSEIFSGPGTERLLGGEPPPGTSPGEVWSTVVEPDYRVVYEEMNAAIAAGMSADAEYPVVGFDGATRWVHDRARPRPIGDDGRLVFDGVLSDITDRREQAEALLEALAELNSTHAALEQAHLETERAARTDPLTGVANRRAFLEATAREFARADRTGHACGVVLLDVDHFKRVNDTHGHDVGDEVLVTVAARLNGAIRPYDALARWGGEEFVVLVCDITDRAVVERVAEGLLSAIRATPITTASGPLPITASAGVAVRTPERTVIEAVIDAADQGLYAAKRRGRNRVVVFDDVTARDTMPEAPEAVRLAEGLAVAASIRESVQALHCSQVADLAARTAAAMALAPDAVLRCRLGGWLHDVGKLALSDDVLRAAASGTLDADQRETFRAHAEVGAAIIAGLPSLTGAADGVRHHHERFDGSGYPHGLRGVAIPIEARIIAAADTYSAITAGRPHQPPLDHDAAIEHLRTVAGYSLDPQVVAAITTVINEPVRPPDTRPGIDADAITGDDTKRLSA